MTEEDDSRLESARKRIVEKHEEDLTPTDMTEALLATAFMLSFFGSAAVLMPSGNASPTGMFSGELTVESPTMETSSIRAVELQGDSISFVHDTEVYNPNVVEAELERVTYEIKVGGETVARGVQDGSTVIPPKDDRMIAIYHELDLSGVSESAEILDRIASGEDSLTVEGVLQFRSGGSPVPETFSRSFRLDLQ